MRTPYVATEHTKELSKAEVTEIFKMYMEEMKEDSHRHENQQGREWTYYKGCTEIKMRRLTGSVFVANVIWEIGLPRLPPFATEQRLPSATDLEAFPEAIKSVLEWLDRIATALLNHHRTPEYKEAVRKSGVVHRESGLDATEQEIRWAIRKAQKDIRNAKELAKQWHYRTLTWDTCKPWQRKLLQAYWDGSLEERLTKATSGGSRDTMCRMPSMATGSFQ